MANIFTDEIGIFAVPLRFGRNTNQNWVILLTRTVRKSFLTNFKSNVWISFCFFHKLKDIRIRAEIDSRAGMPNK